MIVVDSSVWIAHLRNAETAGVAKLRNLDGDDDILVGDLILLEVLQGARDDQHAALIERNLRQFAIAPMLGEALASQAARNFRLLRAKGITIRKTADVIIGSFCIAGGHALLHDDRDFDPMVEHLGLRVF
jgi:predicted nucleic acid-binding protein